MKILIIEDEPQLLEITKNFLEKEKYLVETANTFLNAKEKIFNYEYDCILLDLMLPDGNGIDLLKEIKQNNIDTPIIILSAKNAVEDKVLGLEIGADDYLAKPYHLIELNARLKSAIRRKNNNGLPLIYYKNLTIDTESRRFYVNNQEITLNRKEFEVMLYFAIRPEKLIQKTTLAEAVWGDAIDQTDSYDFIYSQIKNIRKKIKNFNPDFDIQAVYGIGYKLI